MQFVQKYRTLLKALNTGMDDKTFGTGDQVYQRRRMGRSYMGSRKLEKTGVVGEWEEGRDLMRRRL